MTLLLEKIAIILTQPTGGDKRNVNFPPQQKVLNVSIRRGSDASGGSEFFKVPVQKSPTILDVVSWVQQNEDPSLTYRYACRVGMCGSCAMMVHGIPRGAAYNRSTLPSWG